jgi:16S rRNA (guanine1207-N2)-methyltransferase
MLPPMPIDELVFDDGVLKDGPICEFQGWRSVARQGGAAVLPWRGAFLEAEAAEVKALSDGAELAPASYGQCLVRLQKSRPGTWQDLWDAWRALSPGGRLLFGGGNDLGIVSAVKRLAKELGQTPRVLSNRRHGRIVIFDRDGGEGPERPELRQIALPADDEGGDAPPTLEAEPGVFSTRRLDAGSELLLSHLGSLAPGTRVLDVGCGIGPLGLSALLRWPDAQALLLDADARATRSAQRNAEQLGLADRCRVGWWQAAEPVPEDGFDLALCNPPFHTGKQVDLAPAHQMFTRLVEAMTPRGRALIVANRTLPYEAALEGLGRLRRIDQARGYKLLELQRSSRSAGSRGRRAPGSRSAGSS